MNQIVVEDLRFAYPPLEPGGATIPVLHGVNLRVRRGEVLGLLGPTGRAKARCAWPWPASRLTRPAASSAGR